MLPKLPPILVGLALCMAGVVPKSAAQEVMKFSVKGENPGGKGGYQGEVTLSKLSKSTAKIRWVTGTNQEVTNGFAIRTDSAIGAGYGGDALLSLVVYELKGETIEAVWATAAKPEAPGSYVLKGNAFKGTCTFADGSPGSVTFVPGTGGMYKVTWELTAGRFEGIGLRTGNILVAASGAPRGLFGVAAYVPKGKDISGVWATTQTPSPGKELWSLVPGAGPAVAAPGPAAVASQDGQSLVFGGDTYLLKENKSAPGQTTSELREYLQEGETWEGYRKMVGLHMQNVKGADAARLARATLEMVQKQHPSSYVKEIDVEPDSATVLFIVVKDSDVEFNLWNFRKATTGVACAQFVLRNKPPFDSRKKFKAEQDDHIEQWTREIEALGGEAERLLAATAKVPGAAAAAAAPDPAMDQAALAKVINADIEKCVVQAQQYLALAKAGKIADAVNLMTDAAFESMTRAELVSGLESENKTLGKFKSFTPDKEATDFGVKDGIMTYILQGETEYENGTTRDIFRFFRNKQGGIEFTGYNRSIKE